MKVNDYDAEIQMTSFEMTSSIYPPATDEVPKSNDLWLLK
jgi:hypothetical protein